MGGGGTERERGGRGNRVDKVRGWGRGRGAARERGVGRARGGREGG